jgi:hypothetical protein
MAWALAIMMASAAEAGLPGWFTSPFLLLE